MLYKVLWRPLLGLKHDPLDCLVVVVVALVVVVIFAVVLVVVAAFVVLVVVVAIQVYCIYSGIKT